MTEPALAILASRIKPSVHRLDIGRMRLTLVGIEREESWRDGRWRDHRRCEVLRDGWSAAPALIRSDSGTLASTSGFLRQEVGGVVPPILTFPESAKRILFPESVASLP
jgi:hypothetical protein